MNENDELIGATIRKIVYDDSDKSRLYMIVVETLDGHTLKLSSERDEESYGTWIEAGTEYLTMKEVDVNDA